jgi:hypothetical protein
LALPGGRQSRNPCPAGRRPKPSHRRRPRPISSSVSASTARVTTMYRAAMHSSSRYCHVAGSGSGSGLGAVRSTVPGATRRAPMFPRRRRAGREKLAGRSQRWGREDEDGPEIPECGGVLRCCGAGPATLATRAGGSSPSATDGSAARALVSGVAGDDAVVRGGMAGVLAGRDGGACWRFTEPPADATTSRESSACARRVGEQATGTNDGSAPCSAARRRMCTWRARRAA